MFSTFLNLGCPLGGADQWLRYEDMRFPAAVLLLDTAAFLL